MYLLGLAACNIYQQCLLLMIVRYSFYYRQKVDKFMYKILVEVSTRKEEGKEKEEEYRCW